MLPTADQATICEWVPQALDVKRDMDPAECAGGEVEEAMHEPDEGMHDGNFEDPDFPPEGDFPLEENQEAPLEDLPADIEEADMLDYPPEEARSRSRSRSPLRGGVLPPRPRAGMRVPPGAARVQMIVNRLNLDDNAKRVISNLEPEQALGILEQVGEGVRNPSAFVTAMAHRNPPAPGVVVPPTVNRPPPPNPSVSVSDRIEKAIEKLGLDEGASKLILQLPSDKALDILEHVGEDVRNPSAFIAKSALRALQGVSWPPAKPPQPTPAETVEESIVKFGLDDSAARLLRQFPPEQALSMLDQVTDDVRNPSAFVSSICHRALQVQGVQPPRRMNAAPTTTQRVDAIVARMGLDDNAIKLIKMLPPDVALSMLEQIGEGVRNPSAFVTAVVHKVLQALKAGGNSSSAGLTSGIIAGMKMPQEPPPPAHSGRGGSAAAKHGLAEEVTRLAEGMGLDDKCLNVLHSLPVEDAVAILERLASTITSVRNPSAFVFAEATRRQKQPVSVAPPPQASANKMMFCKFYQEGRCKMGSDCRYRHV